VCPQAAALPLAGLVLLLVTAAALAATGGLTQPAGTAGCISHTGSGPCADGHALISVHSPAVSPDGKSVYAISDDAVVRLNRNTTTGAITQPAGTAGCISNTGAGPCADGHALKNPTGVAVSPDGKTVYVTSQGGAGTGTGGGVARLNRNTTTGAITQPAGTAGCISESGSGPCAGGHALSIPTGPAVSSDGKSVYIASNGSHAVVRLIRNTTTGAITQPAGTAGCISEPPYGEEPCADGHALSTPVDVAVSPDGKSVYATARGSSGFGTSAVARLTRNTTTGAISQSAGTDGCVSGVGFGAEPCADGHDLNNPSSVAVSPDGKSVYVTAGSNSKSVVRLNRDTITGEISQPAGTAGCVSHGGTGNCANGHALVGPAGVAVSPDGKSVYVGSIYSDAVVRLIRNTTTGAINQPVGTAGCVSEDGTGGTGPCANGHGLISAGSVAVSPNGKSVYVGASGSDAIARFNRVP
jgi:DNA-binding beta-propeller fold protein YncE